MSALEQQLKDSRLACNLLRDRLTVVAAERDELEIVIEQIEIQLDRKPWEFGTAKVLRGELRKVLAKGTED